MKTTKLKAVIPVLLCTLAVTSCSTTDSLKKSVSDAGSRVKETVTHKGVFSGMASSMDSTLDKYSTENTISRSPYTDIAHFMNALCKKDKKKAKSYLSKEAASQNKADKKLKKICDYPKGKIAAVKINEKKDIDMTKIKPKEGTWGFYSGKGDNTGSAEYIGGNMKYHVIIQATDDKGRMYRYDIDYYASNKDKGQEGVNKVSVVRIKDRESFKPEDDEKTATL